MAELRAFRAIRYDPRVAGDMATLVAPPYDVIDDTEREALYERSPHNVVRLILAREPDRYAAAARRWVEWQRSGVLARDEDASLYFYVQDFAGPDGEQRRRSGLIGAVRLEEFESGRIRPHERTLAKAKADRMRLIAACNANLSPIFGLYRDSGPALSDAHEHARSAPPAIDVTDDAGIRHRVWRILDAALIRHLAELVSAQTIFIADGHHRYETALEYRNVLASKSGLHPEDPANFILMYLCHMGDPGLVILPTHRVVRGVEHFHPRQFLSSLSDSFELRPFPATGDGRKSLLAELHAHSKPGCVAIAVRGEEELHLACLRDLALIDQAAPDLVREVRYLDVTILDRLVLRRLLGIHAETAAEEGLLQYVKGDAEAFAAVQRGDADAAFLLNSTPIEDLEAVSRAGETMPEKSTYFYPKLLTGLVFHALRPADH